MARIKCPRCFEVNASGADRCVKCDAPLPKIKIAAQPMSAQTPANPTQFNRGQVVANRYSVQNLIGRGGMGCIYKVHDNVLGETVALKTLLPQFVKDKMVVERFFNEAKIARKMAHPNIVRVHDIGTADSTVYISMEYLHGQSLRELMETQPGGIQIPLKKSLYIIDELCAALEYAHQYTIHRDIKPENVMIGSDGNVKLMDFGISKLMSNTRMTGASVVMGTPFYMSPEQLKNSRDVDARADVFSVGVVLYEIITGNVPTGVPKPPSAVSSDVPQELDGIIEKCVDPDPRKRYQNATELRTALIPIISAVASGQSVQSHTTQIKVQSNVPVRKVVGVVLAAMVAMVLIAGILWAEGQRKEKLTAWAKAQSNGTTIVGTVHDNDISFETYRNLIPLLQDKSEIAARNSVDYAEVFVAAGTKWEDAETLAKDPESASAAIVRAREAVQHYLAPIMSRLATDMVFVPGGSVQSGNSVAYVAPFFMDSYEVRIKDFSRFVRTVEGGWNPLFKDVPAGAADYPVTNVTFFDAQAFAAWQGKLLPTNLQWSRAAYGGAGALDTYPWEGGQWDVSACNCSTGTPAPIGTFSEDRSWAGCFDMVGNVAEWTRTPYTESLEDVSTTAIDFGSRLVVRGGDYTRGEVPLRDLSGAPFDTAAPQLGFRCVLEIPGDPEAIENLLNALG